jgi:hypothetical protein
VGPLQTEQKEKMAKVYVDRQDRLKTIADQTTPTLKEVE